MESFLKKIIPGLKHWIHFKRVLQLALSFSPFFLFTLPEEGKVASGEVNFSRPEENHLIITASDKAVINYKQFNIDEHETVQFVQPSPRATVLNRVMGVNPSEIFGRLSSNGKLFLINPNGIFFGPHAEVNTGSLIVSTLNIEDRDFIRGKYRFCLDATAKNSKIINHGTLRANESGCIALMAPFIFDEGVISARAGKTALLAGEIVTIDFSGDGLITFAIEGALEAAIIEHLGKISATQGEILIHLKTVDNLLKTVVNVEGLVVGEVIEKENGVTRIISKSELEADRVKLIGHHIELSEEIAAKRSLDIEAMGNVTIKKEQHQRDLSILGKRVTLDAPLHCSTLNVTGDLIDQNYPVKTTTSLTYNGQIYLGGKVNAKTGTITFNGPVIQDTVDSLRISISPGGNGNIVFTSTIDADTPERELFLSTGSGVIELKGPLGLKGCFKKVDITAKKISLADIGGKKPGVLESLSLKAASFNGKRGEIDLYGKIYHTGGQEWDGEKVNLNCEGRVDFISRGHPLTFKNAALHLKEGGHLAIETQGGKLELLSLRAEQLENISISTGKGEALIGDFAGDVGTLEIFGSRVVVVDEIEAFTIRFEAEEEIANFSGKKQISASENIYLNTKNGSIGQAKSPLWVETKGQIYTGSKSTANLIGSSIDGLLHSIPSNRPSLMIFNGVEYYDLVIETLVEEERVSLTPDLFMNVPGGYTGVGAIKPRKALLYYEVGN